MERSYIYTRDLDELDQVMKLFPRDCVECDSTSQLTCPSCPTGESCQFTVPTDCTECPEAVCVKDQPVPSDGSSSDNSGGDDDGGSGPNVGAIAGGVIGGVIVLALLIYLAWRFLIKPKRSEEAARQSAYSVGVNNDDAEKDGPSHLTRRSSTHTVHSIASTVLTRASNIIQIAYIPGVTNRANAQQPQGMLVPPVPPIPMEHASDSGRDSPSNDDQHFFVPGDLRDSTYSGLSGYTNNRASQATHASYAPRSSIASTIYGKQAQVMTPASTGMRAKPTMVSVKSVSGPDAPPVPDVDYDRFGGARPKSAASNFSVGSTFLNTATQARAQIVRVGGGLKQVQIPAKSDSSSSSAKSNNTRAGTTEPETATTTTATAPPTLTINNSPFSDPPSPSTPGMQPTGNQSLSAVAEADGEDDETPNKRPNSLERGTSPFGDEHATK